MATRSPTATQAPSAVRPSRPRSGLSGVAVLGLAGAVALSWGVWRVGALPDRRFRLRWMYGVPVLGSIPLPSRFLGFVLWVVGLAALSAAWVLLRRRTSVPGHDVTVAVVAGLALLWTVPLLLAPPMGSRDVYSYVAHGELAAQGLDPGTVPPSGLGLTSPIYQAVDPIWRHVASAYGPANTDLAQVSVEAAGHHPGAAVVWLRMWCTLGVVLIGIGVVVLARVSGRDPVDALALAVASPLAIVQLIGGPHNEALMAGLMACGVAVACARPSRGGWLAGVALCGLGAAVKLPALVGALYIGWAVDPQPASFGRRTARTVLALGLAVLVIEVLSALSGLSWGTIRGLTAGADVTSILSVSTTLGLALGAVVGQRGIGPVVHDVRNVFLAASAVLAGVLLWRTPRLKLVGLAGALLVLAALGPAVHPWYLTWCLPFAAVVLAGRRATWAMVVAIVAAASTRPFGGGLTRNLGGFGWWSVAGLVVVIVIAVVAVAARRSRARAVAFSG
jgi:hypothetical protein